MATAMRKKKGLVAAAATAGLAASLLVGSPALAASVSCSNGAWGGNCTSEYLNANYSGHYIKYKVCGIASYRIRDYWNSAVVGNGSHGNAFGCKSGTIYGLYSMYRIEIYNSPPYASGTLNNA